MTKVILADSNFIVRAGLRSILTQEQDFVIVAEVKNDAELLEALSIFAVDVVVMDYTAEGFSLDIIQRFSKRNSVIHWIAITGDQSGSVMVGALKAGFKSYIKKDCDFHEIIDAVKETFRGDRYFCGKVIDQIRKENIAVHDLSIVDNACAGVMISERELEIIKYIAEGYTNAEIAELLFLSQHTVNTHRKNIMQKLGVNNTAAIVMYAVKTKLVSPNKFLFSPVLSEVNP
jgi:DNA-binding NarL/FixJ family response regulator